MQVCEKCPNVKLAQESETLTVHIEPGMMAGHVIEFFEEGEPMIDGETGDLKLMVGARRWLQMKYHGVGLVEALCTCDMAYVWGGVLWSNGYLQMVRVSLQSCACVHGALG